MTQPDDTTLDPVAPRDESAEGETDLLEISVPFPDWMPPAIGDTIYAAGVLTLPPEKRATWVRALTDPRIQSPVKYLLEKNPLTGRYLRPSRVESPRVSDSNQRQEATLVPLFLWLFILAESHPRVVLRSEVEETKTKRLAIAEALRDEGRRETGRRADIFASAAHELEQSSRQDLSDAFVVERDAKIQLKRAGLERPDPSVDYELERRQVREKQAVTIAIAMMFFDMFGEVPYKQVAELAGVVLDRPVGRREAQQWWQSRSRLIEPTQDSNRYFGVLFALCNKWCA